jgi:ribose transport system ATP-binding protein
MTSSDLPLLALRGISKRFAGVQALDDVSFELFPGEVHMLLGENGAGKSTLMKVCAVRTRPTPANSFINGEPVTISGPADARRLGICRDLPGVHAGSLPQRGAEHLSRP